MQNSVPIIITDNRASSEKKIYKNKYYMCNLLLFIFVAEINSKMIPIKYKKNDLFSLIRTVEVGTHIIVYTTVTNRIILFFVFSKNMFNFHLLFSITA